MFCTKLVEEIKTHILRSIIYFVENRAVYDIMWKSTVVQDRPHISICHMRNVLFGQCGGEDGGAKSDVNVRIQKSRAAFSRLRKVWLSASI